VAGRSSRNAPTFGPNSAQDSACRSATPGFSGLPIGPIPGALPSAQPSSITLSEIASGLPAGQPNPSALGMKILRSGAVVADFAAKCEVGQRR
jgi:hypothetical protein